MKFKLLVLLALLFCFGCEKENKFPSSLLDFVPKDPIAIIKINNLLDFKEALAANEFLSKIKSMGVYQSIFTKVKNLDYLVPQSESILVFSNLDKNDLEFVFITKDHPKLIDLDKVPNKTVERIAYENYTFDQYKIDGAAFYGTKVDDIRIFSSSQALLENLSNNLDTPWRSNTLARLYETANDTKSASIFINLKKGDAALSSLWIDSSKFATSKFADWISVDVGLGEEYLQLNGIAIASDSIKNYVNLFRKTRPLINTTASFAPFNANAIASYTFDAYDQFSENQQKYLEREIPMDSLFNTVEEIGFIYLNDEKIVVLNTYGSENIADYLLGIKKAGSIYLDNEILELGYLDFFKNSLYPVIDDFIPNFCTILDNAFIFSENKESLQTLISNYKNGSTFDKTSLFSVAMESLASESTFLFISNSEGVESMSKKYFKEELPADIKKSDVSKFVFGTQLISDEDFYHTNTVIQKIEKEARTLQVSPVFTLQLENDLASNPQFVINHITNKKEIVVQDVANMLYLISADGKIIWKKQLEGSIQGHIQQVDIFKNGRLQLAFTTDHQFLILDRNGKEVNPFTFSYEGGNLNPLAVFDYEGKKEYRFVVTQGEKVFMYNNKGTIVRGFKYTRAEKPILGAPQHFVIGNRDYLVFRLADGSLKILNRVGNVRSKVNEKIDFSENKMYQYTNKFIMTDKKGMLYLIDTKGKLSMTNLNLNKDHGIDATSNTLVYMNDNTLSIKGKKLELELGVYTKPQIFYIHDKIYVSVTDIQNQKIYLFDSQAKSIPNFPVYGTSVIDMADVNNDRKFELVAKDQDNSIIVYKMR
ncbi:MAG: ribonuclease HII [Maribacter sp.]|nr:ribonuclease HII [Maribacter sp.]